jgi:DNA-binding transcriptional MerR regulator
MTENATGASVALEKSLYRIGEVSRLTATKAFVLRYWETEFPMLQPVKSAKGHRLYRREDIETVLLIKRLLYEEGFTIAGARRFLEEHDGKAAAAAQPPVAASGGVGAATAPREAAAAVPGGKLAPAGRRALESVREELREILTLLERR